MPVTSTSSNIIKVERRGRDTAEKQACVIDHDSLSLAPEGARPAHRHTDSSHHHDGECTSALIAQVQQRAHFGHWFFGLDCRPGKPFLAIPAPLGTSRQGAADGMDPRSHPRSCSSPWRPDPSRRHAVCSPWAIYANTYLCLCLLCLSGHLPGSCSGGSGRAGSNQAPWRPDPS